MDHEVLGTAVALACLTAYNRLGKTGKPQVHEWTLLAGVVAVEKLKDNDSMTYIYM